MSKAQFAPHSDETVIASGLRIKGQLKASGDVWFDGQIDGSIDSAATVIVASNGLVKGNIKARNIVVSGNISGNLEATASIELHPEARVRGNINCARLKVSEGSNLNGHVSMQAPPSAPTKVS